MDKLKQAREIIDEVDQSVAALFCRRMEAARMIAEYKKERGLPIYDGDRERAVIENNAARVPDPELRGYYISLLQSMMGLSRQYQSRLMEGLHVAYSGVEGAFADIATRRIFPTARHTGFEDFQAAYRAVEDGRCDCAVPPIENSSAGVVGQVMDLMFHGPLHVNGIYTLPVTQNLLGLKGASIREIRRVISHPQALGQCASYLKKHGYETIGATNTAVAARQVAETGDPTVAAIASAETAELYGLEILDHDINESATNSTRFAVFSRVENPAGEKKDDKFLLLFTVNDVAGALAKAINVIGDWGFNMKALISRPVQDKAWQYYFYVETEGDATSPEGRRMLALLSEQCETLKIAGHYAREITLKGGDDV